MRMSNAPCAACKYQRRKCTPECVFAPYFSPDNPQKFINLHKVFGASNVSKLLNELNVNEREDAVNSLAYEAEYRLRDPIYGCVGLISILQHKLRQVHQDLDSAKKELSTYIGPSGMWPLANHPAFMQLQQQQQAGPSPYQALTYNPAQQPVGIPRGGGQLVIREPQPQQQQQMQLQQAQQQQLQLQQVQQQEEQLQRQYLDAQQIVACAAAGRQQVRTRNYEQNELNGGFEEAGGSGSVTATGFNQMGGMAMQQQQTCYQTIPYQQIQTQQQGNGQDHASLQPRLLNLRLNAHDVLQQQNASTMQQQQQQQQQLSHAQRLPTREDRSIGPAY